MTYLRPHNRSAKSRPRIGFVAVLAAAVLAGIIQLSAPHFFPALFTSVARPFWTLELSIGSGAFRSAANILKENELLKLELADYEIRHASSSVQILEAENASLLELLGRASTSPNEYILGAILARPSAVPYDELVIDIGEKQGVSTSTLVYANSKVLIGRVREVLPNSAKVVLFSSPKESHDVLIGPSRVPATAMGKGGGQYRAEVPHGSEIEVGDGVTDSTLYGRAFGVVVSVVTDPSNPFDTVLFAPPVNINQLRFVLVRP